MARLDDLIQEPGLVIFMAVALDSTLLVLRSDPGLHLSCAALLSIQREGEKKDGGKREDVFVMPVTF